MNSETKFVIDYLMSCPEFLENIKSLLSFNGEGKQIIHYLKKSLDLKDDTELTQVQVNLFYAAMNNIDWQEIITKLKAKTTTTTKRKD